VYRARDSRLDRSVAIKVLPAAIAADAQARERFEREARAVAALNHPHICTLHDIGRHLAADGRAVDVLVLEHLEGETLATRLERGPLPLEQALACASQIAAALDRAHRAGIVLRDVKPANIMLTKAGAKLLDFGLAKFKAPATPISLSGMTERATLPGTAQGTIPGTIQYMAPEQVEGKEADARSDIWALGAVIYEMVTGARPFPGDTPASVIGAILKDTPPPISTLQPQAPGDAGPSGQSVSHLGSGRPLAERRGRRTRLGRDRVHPGGRKSVYAAASVLPHRAVDAGVRRGRVVCGGRRLCNWFRARRPNRIDHTPGGAGCPRSRARRLAHLGPASCSALARWRTNRLRINGPRRNPASLHAQIGPGGGDIVAGHRGRYAPSFAPDGTSVGFFVAGEAEEDSSRRRRTRRPVRCHGRAWRELERRREHRGGARPATRAVGRVVQWRSRFVSDGTDFRPELLR